MQPRLFQKLVWYQIQALKKRSQAFISPAKIKKKFYVLFMIGLFTYITTHA